MVFRHRCERGNHVQRGTLAMKISPDQIYKCQRRALAPFAQAPPEVRTRMPSRIEAQFQELVSTSEHASSQLLGELEAVHQCLAGVTKAITSCLASNVSTRCSLVTITSARTLFTEWIIDSHATT